MRKRRWKAWKRKMELCEGAKMKSEAKKPGSPCCHSCSFLNTLTYPLSPGKPFILISKI